MDFSFANDLESLDTCDETEAFLPRMQVSPCIAVESESSPKGKEISESLLLRLMQCAAPEWDTSKNPDYTSPRTKMERAKTGGT